MHLVSLECEKAFNSLSFNAILGAVVHFPLRGVIRQLVCFQRLRIHGTNPWLYPDMGTPQGGVLSPLLFNAVIEILHKKMEKLPKITIRKLKINNLQ